MVKLAVAIFSVRLLEGFLNTQLTLVLLISLLMALGIAYVKPNWLSLLMEKIGLNLNRLKRYTIQGRPTNTEKLSLFLLAALKFSCYNLQFLVLIWLFADPELSGKLLLSIAAFYALSAFIPSWALADFAIKAGRALLLLAPFNISASAIVYSNIIIWALNLALPALIGAIALAKNHRVNGLKNSV